MKHNREITQFELALIMAVCLLGALLCSGCATPYYKHYRIETPIDIIVADSARIQLEYLRNGGRKGKTVNGFYNDKTRTIFIKRQAMNCNLPKLYTFGHEMLHLPEIEGRFHD